MHRHDQSGVCASRSQRKHTVCAHCILVVDRRGPWHQGAVAAQRGAAQHRGHAPHASARPHGMCAWLTYIAHRDRWIHKLGHATHASARPYGMCTLTLLRIRLCDQHTYVSLMAFVPSTSPNSNTSHTYLSFLLTAHCAINTDTLTHTSDTYAFYYLSNGVLCNRTWRLCIRLSAPNRSSSLWTRASLPLVPTCARAVCFSHTRPHTGTCTRTHSCINVSFSIYPNRFFANTENRQYRKFVSVM